MKSCIEFAIGRKITVEWAKKLQSELRLAEVRRAYDGLVLAFAHEPRMAALKEQIMERVR